MFLYKGIVMEEETSTTFSLYALKREIYTNFQLDLENDFKSALSNYYDFEINISNSCSYLK